MVRLILAARGGITNPFGAKNPPGAALRYHLGVDIGSGGGRTIYAPAAGIASARSSGGALGTYGNYWWIAHDDGTASVVAHLASHVGRSRRVAQGEVIGVMGRTGTYQVHCHQEYIVAGERVDPTKYLGGTAGGDVTPIPIPEPIEIQLEGLDVDTILIGIADGRNKYKGGANARYFALWHIPTNKYTPVKDTDSANQFVRGFGRPNADGSQGSAEFNLTYGDWERIVGPGYPYLA